MRKALKKYQDHSSTFSCQIPRICLSILISICGILICSPLFANPEGGVVAHGNATITNSSNTVHINQSSDKAIINWQSFNIGAQEKTQFHQPSANSVTLNRINAAHGASQIYGQLIANGQIILTNSAGIYFGPTAYVNVGGLMATTASLSNTDFLNGNYHFTSDTSSSGSIINEGTIIVAEHGLAALVAPGVVNNGLIQANLGHVILASGEAFTVSFAADGLVNFAIDQSTSHAGIDQHGNRLLNGVSNAGKIIANGGTILMTAKAAAGVLDNAINMEGIAQAHAVSSHNGEIILLASEAGNVKVTGHLDVSGENQANGGTILIWSNHTTKFYGTINAEGGALGGNGGFVETSGAYLDVHGSSINLSARFGTTGTWLLDPENLIIQTAGPTTTTAAGIPTNTYTSNVDTSILTIADLQNALANASIIVQTGLGGSEAGDITVANNITWNNANTLTLTAFRHININAGITNTLGGSLTLHADNTGTGVGTITFTGAAPQINISGGGAVNFYYNPTSFPTPTNYSSNVNVSGGTVFTSSMLINNASQLQNMNSNLSGNYALSKNITLSGNFTPIGTAATPFTGKFNGLNNSIDGLSITNTTPNTDLGLFGAATGATIQNIILKNVSISETTDNTGSSIYIGSLVGLMNGGTIDNASVINPTITASGTNFGINGSRGYYDIGGLIGASFGGTVSNSLSNGGSITSNVYTNPGANMIAFHEVGGFIGGQHGAAALQNISSSTSVTTQGNVNVSAANATGELLVGGLIGRLDQLSTLLNSNSSGAVTVTSTQSVPSSSGAGYVLVGGLIGATSVANPSSPTPPPYIGNSFSTSAVTLNATLTNSQPGSAEFLAGGLLGQSNAIVENSYSSGAVVGTLAADLTAQNNFFYVGGFAGNSFTMIKDSYSTSSVTITGTNNGSLVKVGGLVGGQVTLFDKEITQSFSSGTINVTLDNLNGGRLSVGGLIGTIIYYGSAATTWPFENNYSTSAINVSGLNNASLTTIGGLIGANGEDAGDPGANIKYSYSQGIINTQISTTNGGTTDIGGFIGANVGTSATLTNNFWDTDTSGYNQNQGVGDTPGLVVGLTPGCFGGLCVNGGTANLSARTTFTNDGWDFINTWGIIEGQSYPYLLGIYLSTPQVFSGTAQGTIGSNVTLVANGSTIGTASTGANGFFYFLVPNGLIGTTPLLAYLSGSSVGNLLFKAPSAGLSVSGLQLSTNTLTIGGINTTAFSNTDLTSAIGNLVNPNILYSYSGVNNVTFGNNAHPNINFITTPTTTYTLNGNLVAFPGATSTITFAGPLVLGSNATLMANSINISNGITGGYNLSAIGSAAGNNTLSVNTGGFENWIITGLDQGNIIVPSVTGIFSFANIQNLNGGNNGNTFTFNNGTSISGLINGGNTSYINTLNYTPYSTPVSVLLSNPPYAGTVQNNIGNTITHFNNINNVIVNQPIVPPQPISTPTPAVASIITPFNILPIYASNAILLGSSITNNVDTSFNSQNFILDEKSSSKISALLFSYFEQNGLMKNSLFSTYFENNHSQDNIYMNYLAIILALIMIIMIIIGDIILARKIFIGKRRNSVKTLVTIPARA